MSSPRWRRRPEQRPGQILAAALGEFSERGLEAARVEDIAERAGVSKATVYQYFESKVELFRAVVRTTLGELVAAVEAEEGASTASEALRRFVRAYWRQLRSPDFEAVYRLVLAEVNAYPELVREYAAEVRVPIRTACAAILERGVAEGEFRAGDSGMRARMLLALLIKHAVWCARREFLPDLGERGDDEVLDEIMTFFFAAVGVDPSRVEEGV